jgi:triosephosphate isomerase
VVVAGNWKMHQGPEQTRAFLTAFARSVRPNGPELLLFPPAVSLSAAVAAAGARGLGVGAQNIHWVA